MKVCLVCGKPVKDKCEDHPHAPIIESQSNTKRAVIGVDLNQSVSKRAIKDSSVSISKKRAIKNSSISIPNKKAIKDSKKTKVGESLLNAVIQEIEDVYIPQLKRIFPGIEYDTDGRKIYIYIGDTEDKADRVENSKAYQKLKDFINSIEGSDIYIGDTSGYYYINIRLY